MRINYIIVIKYVLTNMNGKTNPTVKLLNQFTMVAMVTATGLVDC